MKKAKLPPVRRRKSAKIVGAAECLNTQTAPDRNGQTLTEGAHRVTAIPHSNPTPPVRTDNRVDLRGDAVQANGKTRNAELAERLDMYFGGTSWAIGAFCSMHGHEISAADLRNAVEEQLDKLKADVLSAVEALFTANPESPRRKISDTKFGMSENLIIGGDK